MKTIAACAAVAWLFSLPAAAQDKPAEAKKPAEVKKPAEPMPMPKAGPEHELLKKDAGVWDATVEWAMAPGAPAQVSKGVETNTMLGDLWLVTDFKSEMMGQPFQGHGIAGYDPAKKKYVSTWTDSMSTTLGMMESTYDAAKKTLTGSMEAPDMTGKPTTHRMATEWKDADTRIFSICSPGPDGKEFCGLKITYKRRK